MEIKVNMSITPKGVFTIMILRKIDGEHLAHIQVKCAKKLLVGLIITNAYLMEKAA